jgi:small subunit ribosomal protein S16
VISEKTRDTFGRSLEILGHYHPSQKDDKDKLVINKERIEHWLSNGAGTSKTVHNLLLDAGLIKGDKLRTIGKYKSAKQVEAEKKSSEEKPEEVKEEDKKGEAPKAEDKPKEEKPQTQKIEAPTENKQEDK